MQTRIQLSRQEVQLDRNLGTNGRDRLRKIGINSTVFYQFRERRCRFSNSSRHWCPSSVWSNRSPISNSSAAFISRLKRSRTRTIYYVLQNIIYGSEVFLIQFDGSLRQIIKLIKMLPAVVDIGVKHQQGLLKIQMEMATFSYWYHLPQRKYWKNHQNS